MAEEKRREIHKRVEECIHCNACKRKCKFLTKYDICIGDTEKLKELAYHCYLCGECTRVCPKGIDGREIILDFRKEQVKEGKYGLKQRGYSGILLEKKNYLFKNHRKAKGAKTVFFPGCNFPAYYPKTLEKLLSIFAKVGIPPFYDCCGKPVLELGLEAEANAIFRRLNQRFQEFGIEEIVLACPNCYYHFGNQLNVKITTVYDKLKELGVGKKVEGEYSCFYPCPDREDKVWMEGLSHFIAGEISEKKNLQCCGMGGCAFVQEAELSKEMAKSTQGGEKPLISYCSTCIGQFTKEGNSEAEHFLPLILETGEKADYSHSFWNRFKHKFY